MKEEVLKREKAELEFSLLKIITGSIIGTIFGLLQLKGGMLLWFSLALLIPMAFIGRLVWKELKDIHPVRLIFLYGSLGYLVAIMLFWTLVYNLLSPIPAE